MLISIQQQRAFLQREHFNPRLSDLYVSLRMRKTQVPSLSGHFPGAQKCHIPISRLVTPENSFVPERAPNAHDSWNVLRRTALSDTLQRGDERGAVEHLRISARFCIAAFRWSCLRVAVGQCSPRHRW